MMATLVRDMQVAVDQVGLRTPTPNTMNITLKRIAGRSRVSENFRVPSHISGRVTFDLSSLPDRHRNMVRFALMEKPLPGAASVCVRDRLGHGDSLDLSGLQHRNLYIGRFYLVTAGDPAGLPPSQDGCDDTESEGDAAETPVVVPATEASFVQHHWVFDRLAMDEVNLVVTASQFVVKLSPIPNEQSRVSRDFAIAVPARDLGDSPLVARFEFAGLTDDQSRSLRFALLEKKDFFTKTSCFRDYCYNGTELLVDSVQGHNLYIGRLKIDDISETQYETFQHLGVDSVDVIVTIDQPRGDNPTDAAARSLVTATAEPLQPTLESVLDTALCDLPNPKNDPDWERV